VKRGRIMTWEHSDGGTSQIYTHFQNKCYKKVTRPHIRNHAKGVFQCLFNNLYQLQESSSPKLKYWTATLNREESYLKEAEENDENLIGKSGNSGLGVMPLN
jgi:hypothetical protein